MFVRRAHKTEGSSLCQFLPFASKSWNIIIFIPCRSNPLVCSTCPFVCGCAANEGWWWIPKSAQHLKNLTHLHWVPLSVRILFGTPNLYTMLLRNLTAASCVIFTTGVASIHLVNVSMPMNKNLKPPGALGRMLMISTPHTTKGQDRSMGQRGFACFVVCFWKNWHSLHLVMIFIASSLAVGQYNPCLNTFSTMECHNECAPQTSLWISQSNWLSSSLEIHFIIMPLAPCLYNTRCNALDLHIFLWYWLIVQVHLDRIHPIYFLLLLSSINDHQIRLS
jgi:hypothetical protein